jgi:hypothetical protein
MNAISKIILTVGAMTFSACSNYVVREAYAQDTPVTLQVFYDQLDPYGMWVDFPTYGYVWIPDVPVEFSPYVSSGHWVYTHYGWTWHSYYRWGWAPFHYGRWHHDARYGWLWIPDTVWGPAWVVWRSGGGYCGWAPLGPNIRVDIVISGNYHVPSEHWVFVPEADLSRDNISRHRVDRTRNNTIMENAPVTKQVRSERNVTYMPGPDRTEIQQRKTQSTRQVDIRERNDPGKDRLKKDRLELFKPEIQRQVPGGRNVVPGRVFRLDEINKSKSPPSNSKDRTGTTRSRTKTK